METVLLHKSAFLYVTSIFRLSSFVFANALLTGITKTFVPFYSSFPEIYRKIVRDQTYVDQTDNLFHLNLPQDSGFESTEGAYDLKEMHRVVNALPKEYKVPFSMHVSGFKYREIAEKLELPLGTVKSRIFFTRQRLQQELKDFV